MTERSKQSQPHDGPIPASTMSSKALNAILPLISSNQPYEAHQKARTFASRYSKAKQYETAIDVLFQSARELLKIGQQGSGTDLAVFLLDVYESKGEEVGEESRGNFELLWWFVSLRGDVC
jgi:golgi to ER traffic protein 4